MDFRPILIMENFLKHFLGFCEHHTHLNIKHIFVFFAILVLIQIFRYEKNTRISNR